VNGWCSLWEVRRDWRDGAVALVVLFDFFVGGAARL